MSLFLKRPLYSSRNLKDLDPQFSNQVSTLIANLKAKHNYDFFPTCTLRGALVQARLFAQSRTHEMCEEAMAKAGLTYAEAPWLVGLVRQAPKLSTKGGHVTKALPGQSFHHYGWAADLVYSPRKGVIDYSHKPAWTAFRNEAVLVGLVCLSWETAHVQAPSPSKIPYTWAEIERLLKP